MSHPQQQKSGTPWSGANKIPNINEFIGKLDKDKAKRDAAIEKHNEQSNEQQGVTAHQNETRTKTGKTVTDPVTGHQVVIEDVGKEFMKNVDNPTVGCPPLEDPSTDNTSSLCPMPTLVNRHLSRRMPHSRILNTKRNKT